MISFISSLENINIVVREAKSEGRSDSNALLWTAAYAGDVAVNPNRIKTLLANGLSTFSIKGEPVFSTGPISLSKNPPGCPILCNWAFDNLY